MAISRSVLSLSLGKEHDMRQILVTVAGWDWQVYWEVTAFLKKLGWLQVSSAWPLETYISPAPQSVNGLWFEGADCDAVHKALLECFGQRIGVVRC